MIYKFDLRLVGFVVGIALLIAHVVALVHGNTVRAFLKTFPRSKRMGSALLVTACLWAFYLVFTMDLGEFTNYRPALMILVPVSGFLTFIYVDEFLPVRSLGMLLLLLAEPVLESAFLRPETSKLLLVVLAYIWAVAGLFWVGMPYLMRDQIGWALKTNGRWTALCAGGLIYGVAIIFCSIFFYQQA